MVLVAAVLLTAATLLFTLLVRAQDIPDPAPVSPAQHLEDRKAQIYENLRDLQFEYRVGKLSDDDYQKTKLELQAELTRVLAEIDQILGPLTPVTAKPAALAAPKSGTKCPHCGAKFPQPLKFCGECGKAIA